MLDRKPFLSKLTREIEDFINGKEITFHEKALILQHLFRRAQIERETDTILGDNSDDELIFHARKK